MTDSTWMRRMQRKLRAAAFRMTSAEFVSKVYFRIVLKRKLHLDAPKSFNEKLQWLKLYYWPNEDKAIQCADKYAVREYIRSIGKESVLNELYDVWDDTNDIVWDDLPDSFVLKCNHGCGYNIICPDKKLLDRAETIRQLDQWMHENYSEFGAEMHYAKIPRKIVCEKYLGDRVINYNIYVFNGKAVFLSVAGGLGDGKDEHLTYYYPDGRMAPFRNARFEAKEEELSPLLPDMIDMAESLSEGFPMVRVDLFDIEGHIVLSEMTFTPGCALIPFSPDGADAAIGDLLDISALIRTYEN